MKRATITITVEFNNPKADYDGLRKIGESLAEHAKKTSKATSAKSHVRSWYE